MAFLCSEVCGVLRHHSLCLGPKALLQRASCSASSAHALGRCCFWQILLFSRKSAKVRGQVTQDFATKQVEQGERCLKGSLVRHPLRACWVVWRWQLSICQVLAPVQNAQHNLQAKGHN